MVNGTSTGGRAHTLSQVAHNLQFKDFNEAWNKYLEEYDRMAQMYVQQMTERHAVGLMEHQKKLQQELRDKPPKWSKVGLVPDKSLREGLEGFSPCPGQYMDPQR